MVMGETVLDVQANEAREFFLRQSSFCNIGLPSYFDFQDLLTGLLNFAIANPKHLFCVTRRNKDVSDVFDNHPKKYEDVNYHFYSNKDGRFDWRPLQIINPVIYVYLVKEITEPENWRLITDRFNDFKGNGNIQCFSIPLLNHSRESAAANSIANWWNNIEQETIKNAMDYNYMLNTDITDCYGSIYTHSIAWAMSGKEESKQIRFCGKEKTKQYIIGDTIDLFIEAMSYQQTNGIPQGSVLMDFIAEMVLGYADLELSRKLKNQNIDYKIIRYRDDYRIFGKTQEDVIKVAKLLTEVLSDLNLKLNTTKTTITQDVISGAIKPDKLYYICQDFKRLEDNDSGYTLQKQLLRIYKLSIEHPNSGMLQKAIEVFFKRLCENNNTDMFKESAAAQVLISIVTNIAYNNPRVYKIAVAIIGKILSYETDAEVVKKTYERILKKFNSLPNVGYLEIWLQRLTIKHDRSKFYNESICQYAAGGKRLNLTIWNISWLKDDVQKIFIANPIVNEDEINNLSEVIEYKEIETFNRY